MKVLRYDVVLKGEILMREDVEYGPGSIVRSIRDPNRAGKIVAITPESNRPLVLWMDNNRPIIAEWRHIDFVSHTHY